MAVEPESSLWKTHRPFMVVVLTSGGIAMRRMLAGLGGLVVLLTAGAALAQGNAVSWSGIYAGVNAGGGVLNDSGLQQCISPINGISGNGCEANVNFGSLSGSGFVGGAQIGFGAPVPLFGLPTVLGMEFDMQGTSISGSATTSQPASEPAVGGGVIGVPSTFTAKQSIDWLSTMRVRLGYAGIDRFLIYGTAGVAFAQVNESAQKIFPTLTYFAQGGGVRAGPTIGGGVEYSFMQNVSARVEGLYYDLGTSTIFGGPTPAVTAFSVGKEFRTRGAIFRLGLNYRFVPWSQ